MKKYTEEQFIKVVTNSTSICQALVKLGLKPAGGNYQSFYNLVKKLSLDISHLKGQAWNKGQIFGPKRPIIDYLSNQHTIQSHKLKKRLIKEGYFTHKCNECNLSIWRNKKISLELHHIDGNHKNNQLDNLTLLCPNCHAQTANYRANRGTSY